MRTYIFTQKERQAVRRFLDGLGPRDDPVLMTTISRVKSFKDLVNDVNLYIRLRETIAASST